MTDQEHKDEIEVLESALAELVNQRKDLQKQINNVRIKIHNLKVYNKYYKSVINHNKNKSGATCEELFGKQHKCLSADELRQYSRIKQAERRARVKAERGNQC